MSSDRVGDGGQASMGGLDELKRKTSPEPRRAGTLGAIYNKFPRRLLYNNEKQNCDMSTAFVLHTLDAHWLCDYLVKVILNVLHIAMYNMSCTKA